MDDKKKQMLLIGVLAVAGLGWGSYYFLIRDSGTDDLGGMNTAPVERRVREDIAERKDQATTRRAPRKAPPKERVQPTRREREAADTTTESRRRVRAGKDTKVKKKKILPAA